MSEMVLYDSMVRAINACHQVDELKDMHDQAHALEMYARQAKNVEAERRAVGVRIRAERRVGQLLQAMQRTPRHKLNSTGANQHEVRSNDWMQPKSEYATGIERAGLTPQTAHRWQSLAKVPEHEFEDAMSETETMPTTSAILRRQQEEPAPSREPVRMDSDALGIWGRLRDVENITSRRMPDQLLSQMTEPMFADLQRIVPSLIEWLQQMKDDLYE
jgi:hypothetical protein